MECQILNLGWPRGTPYTLLCLSGPTLDLNMIESSLLYPGFFFDYPQTVSLTLMI